jgi:hypothetical protein
VVLCNAVCSVRHIRTQDCTLACTPVAASDLHAAGRVAYCGVSDGELLIGDGVGIVRIGNTARRPLRPFSLTVQAYLAHLRGAWFTGAPLPFG